LFSGKSIKTAATREALFDTSMHQIVRRLGLPRTLYVGLRGPTSKGTGWEEEGREGRGRREFVLCPRKKKDN